MSDKFADLLNGEYAERIEAIYDVIRVTNSIGRELSHFHDRDKFIPTALQFARSSVETAPAIIVLLKQGAISQSYVLLRWYLEFSNLYYYLSMNRDQYELWIRNDQMRPRDVRHFFREQGLPTWKTTYDDWCNVMHCNHVFLDNYHMLAKLAPISELQNVTVGQALMYTAMIAQKLNLFMQRTVFPYMSSGDVLRIRSENDKIDQELRRILIKQQDLEREIMNR